MDFLLDTLSPDNVAQSRKGESSGVTSKDSIYQNETAEPCYFSSSIYYGGQENYSPRTTTTHESQHVVSITIITLFVHFLMSRSL